MAVSGDVTIAQDGQGNIKLHPYLVALVRWCMSCLWSTATVVLHRLMTTPLPPIAASKSVPKPRAAGNDHLHPEPKVDCVVLHTPPDPKIDVIFVHGLYGSLGNTWRQGDWRPKYKIEPNKVPLIKPQIPCNCQNINTNEQNLNKNEQYNAEEFSNITDVTYKNTFYKQMKILPNENVFITEKFYDNTILDQVEIVDNYEMQANFVRDLFEKECNECDSEFKFNNEDSNESDCECKLNEVNNCDVGCGCVCDECYSTCWPKDWIKADYPDARVISINYTSDPHLWRPLWVKGHKRLRLHERAEQMTRQLLHMGVGDRPIIWVGHSKGGLFIKQIYCEAYEAYLKRENIEKSKNIENDNNESNIFKDFEDNNANTIENGIEIYENNSIQNNNRENVKCNKAYDEKAIKDNIFSDNNLVNDNITNNNTSNVTICVNNNLDDNLEVNKDMQENDFLSHSTELENRRIELGTIKCEIESSSNTDEDLEVPVAFRASLWTNSAGFMFYSVPHRGSPLADIKMPITARSIELLEISKDCALVLSLQERWLRATAPLQPAVRSLVETTRTLMSVLWLRIVSEHSADAGIGALYGVSVDHREICKPSSRRCLLYTELMKLMRSALNKCRCQ